MNASTREMLEAPYPTQPRPTTWIYKFEHPEMVDGFMETFHDYEDLFEAEEAARYARSHGDGDVVLWAVSNTGTWIQLALIRKDHLGQVWTDVTPSGTRFL